MQLVGRILLGADEQVAQMVAERVPHMRGGFGACVTAGVVKDQKLIGGIVYHNYVGHMVEMSGAFDDPKWCLPKTVRALLDIPFNQMGAAVVVMRVARKNKRARKIVKGVGFVERGIIPKGYDGKDDVVIYAMTRDECRWIKGLN